MTSCPLGRCPRPKPLGLSVPDEIGFIGLNDMEMAQWANINLTTIHNPIKQVVASTVELVVAMLSDPTDIAQKAVLFPGRVL